MNIQKTKYDNLTIAIIGGGNMGLAIACEAYKNTGCNVNFITSHPEDFTGEIKAVDSITGESYYAKTAVVTDDYDIGLKDVDIIFITFPVFLFKHTIKKIKLNKPTTICLIPGFGGREFYCRNLIDEGHTLCGLNRTPYIARTTRAGKEVLYSQNDDVRFTTLHASPIQKKQVHEKIQSILGIEMKVLNNFMAITLTPSNPILHTSRLCTMFKNATFDTAFDRVPYFYKEWDYKASEVLIKADNDVDSVYKFFKNQGVDFTGMVSIKDRYQGYSPKAMTESISGVQALEKITTPMLEKNGKYYLDPNTRYLTEDFPYGLCVLKGFALIAGLTTPGFDEILGWYQKLSGKKYFNVNELGKHISETSAPQDFGIKTVEDVINFYV